MKARGWEEAAADCGGGYTGERIGVIGGRSGKREGEGRWEEGCERVAGFPGFVVMTTKPPLCQTRQRFDGNGHTNAESRGGVEEGEREREGGRGSRMMRCRQNGKERVAEGKEEREGEREGVKEMDGGAGGRERFGRERDGDGHSSSLRYATSNCTSNRPS